MCWIKSALAVMVVCVLGSLALAQNAAPATVPGDAGPLVITATPDPAAVHPGDTMKLNVVIKNISKDEQTIRVPSIIWAAGTDVPQVVIPGWPARGGIGPVVTFRPVAIAAGESYAHTWSANVSSTAELGDVTFRVGVPLGGAGSGKTWSEPLKVKIVAKDAPKEPAKDPAKDALNVGGVNDVTVTATVAGDNAPKDAAKDVSVNPLYAGWKGQDGKTVTFNRSETISGGAPIPGGNARPAATSTVTYAFSEINADRAVIKVTRDANAGPDLLIIPASVPANDPAFPKPAGKEDLKIGDKTYSCTKYTYSTKSKEDMGRDGQGLSGRVTVWVADGVPGGVVQRKISLTIRVSYDITETMSP